MTANSLTKALEDKNKLAVISQYRGDFAAVLPTHMRTRVDQWVRLTQGAFRRNQALQNVLKNNPGSVLAALLDCARLGLEIGDTYHLVPMGGEVKGIADYTGIIELIYRANAVSTVQCGIVYERDLEHHTVAPGVRRPRFEYVKSEMDRPYHAPDWFSDRGAMIGAYAYAEMRGGGVSHVVIRNAAEIEKVRAVSKTAHHPDSPWRKWPDRMWLKTVIRELAKFVPTSAEDRRTGGPVEIEELPPLVLHDGDFVDGEIVDDDAEQPPVNDPSGT